MGQGNITFEERKRRQSLNVKNISENLDGKPEKYKCEICKRERQVDKFYATYIHSKKHKQFEDIGKFTTICKECLIKMAKDSSGRYTLDNVRKSCMWLDIPCREDIILEGIRDGKFNLGLYYKKFFIRNYCEYDYAGWENKLKEKVIEESHEAIQSGEDNNKSLTNLTIQELKDKFGDGYPDTEYYLFEKKYLQLRPSAKILTTFHDEFFKEYCVNKVKETLAKSKGDFKEAKEWASMAKDAATSGKLNPSQMSKADLTGGMDTFGQMAKMVEETPSGELQKILPKFIERPKDKVDVVLWCYVNYIRDLKGLPSCEYKDIYDFYEVRRESYEKQMLDGEDPSDSEEE